MDDVDAFLASLDQFTSPTIASGIERQHQQPAASQGRALATPSASPSDVSFPTSRRRQRQVESQEQAQQRQQRQRRDNGSADGPSYVEVDADSPAQSPSTALRVGSSQAWWCVRCSAENSGLMQSCAICHRRRERAEGPRPVCTLASSSSATQQAAGSMSAATNIRDSPIGEEPVVIAAPGEVSCPRCTFLNPSSRDTCEMCEGPLPASVSCAPSFSTAATATFAPSAAALAAVPSIALPGLGGVATSPSSRQAASSPPTTTPSRAGFPERLGTTNDASLGAAADMHPPPQRPNGLRDAMRETLSLAPAPMNTADPYGDDSSESGDDTSSDDDASDHDSDWSDRLTCPYDAADHRELVRFLESMQSVQFDDLPCAAVPPSMQAHGELRPFQLQALYWLLSREQNHPQLASRSARPFPDCTNVKSESSRSDSEAGISAPALRRAGGPGSKALTDEDSVAFSLHDSTSGRVKRGVEDSNDWLMSADDVVDVTPSGPSAAPLSKDMTDTVRGGVLADYMGLGKTRTLVALCEAARAPRVDRVTGSLVETTATLIVCPTALLTQWVEEIERCVVRPATAPLRILVYYGARKRRQTLFQVAQSYDYVITTYQTLTHEKAPVMMSQGTSGVYASRSGGGLNGNGGSGGALFGADPYDYMDELSTGEEDTYSVDQHLQTEVGKLFMIRWARIILDEAHYIRNMRTRQSRACLKLSGVCKWAVTATPVQNSLNDLYPLLRFLDVPHFSSLQWWNDEIVRYFNVDPQHPRPVTALRILFRSILLRRTPDSVVNGKPILDLPPKRVVTHTVALSREETQFYRAVHTKATEKLNALRQRDTFVPHSPLATFTTAFEMLVRCRQTCLHPYIVVAALRRCHRLPSGLSSGEASKYPTQSAASATNNPSSTNYNDKTAALLQAQREQLQRETEERTARALDQFIQSVVLRRLRTIKASEFVQSLVAEIKTQKLESRDCNICLDTVNRPAILPCAHVFCKACIADALDVTRRCPLCKRTTKLSEVLLVPVELLNPAQDLASSATLSTGNSAAAAAASGSGKGSEKEKDSGRDEVGLPPEVPLDLDLTNVANWSMPLSSKTQFLIQTITHLPQEDKVVVFSTFLTYLHFAQHWLEEAGISCAIFSGSMTMKQKQLLLERFRDTAQPNSPRVLLATTSSCGVGLNLTCANHCFLMEPSWNPGTEEQALNRVHRIGQTKPVTVTKLIADATIEQNICQLCERKRALSGYCFGGGGAGGGGAGGDGRLRTADLLQLFAPEPESSDEESEDEESSDDE